MVNNLKNKILKSDNRHFIIYLFIFLNKGTTT